MKYSDSFHLKIQDLCTCFSHTDPLKEMSALASEPESEEAAMKWIALAALHGVAAGASKISLKEDKTGNIRVTAEYRKTELPSPGNDAGNNIFDVFRKITHIEGEKGKTALALGIQDSSIELTVGIKEKEEKRKISIKFPET